MPEPIILPGLDTRDAIIIAGAVGAIVVAICSGLFLAWNSWRDRAATDKRHLREQALKLALEQWLQETKAASVHTGSHTSISISGQPPSVSTTEYHGPPARDLHEIVFRALKFVDAFSKNEVTESNLRGVYSKPEADGHEE
jgi:hypothetical protein